MNIVMMTNTYFPFVGGIEKSISSFSEQLKKMGHNVLIVAPEFDDMPENEQNVIRLPAIQRFNGTDFSVQLPVPGILGKRLDKFKPDIIHSHHPYLIGSTGMRIAVKRELPLIFTFHTFFEKYTHYVPGDSPALKRFVIQLSTGYANLSTHVIAPSTTVRGTLVKRGVKTPVSVIPTGIDTASFRSGNKKRFLEKASIPEDSNIIGFVSRLAPEKNIDFLKKAVAQYMEKDKSSYFAIAGDGPSRNSMLEFFADRNLDKRVYSPGTLEGSDLYDCYKAMDLFVFASQTETQGMVLTESLAAGVPVAALDGPGVSDVVENGINGALIKKHETEDFVNALNDFFGMSEEERKKYSNAARKKAENFTLNSCSEKLTKLYEQVLSRKHLYKPIKDSAWERSQWLIKKHWDMFTNVADSIQYAVKKRE